MSKANAMAELVPIVVAVTGHRDIPEGSVPGLEAKVKEVLLRLKEPDSLKSFLPEESKKASAAQKGREGKEATPFILLSALAEGADRLVARVAVKQCGYRLGVILPMPASGYLKDFETLESVKEFEELMGVASFVHVVDPEEHPQGPDRDRSYLDAGLYLCRHSQILLALWDGDDVNPKVGGTADIVCRQLTGEITAPVSEASPLEAPESGPVVHIKMVRAKEKGPYPESFEASLLTAYPLSRPQGQVSAKWDAVLGEIHRFNRDAIEFLGSAEGRLEFKNGVDWLRFDKTWSSESALPPLAIAPVARRIAALHAVADAMSRDAQEARKKTLRWIMAATALALLLNELYTGPVFHPGILLATIFAVGGACLLFHWRIRSGRLEQRYLDYRAFAEILRVQYFWESGGMQRRAADYCLRNRMDELEWLRQAAINAYLPVVVESVEKPLPTDAEYIYVHDRWVADQRVFFGKKIVPTDPPRSRSRNLLDAVNVLATGEKHNGTLREISKGFDDGFLLFLTMGGVLALTTLAAHLRLGWGSTEVAGAVLWLIVGYQMSIVVAALFKVYREVMAFEEDGRRYEKAFQVFDRAMNFIDAEKSPARRRELLFALGCEALSENEEWLTRHHEREVEIPIG